MRISSSLYLFLVFMCVHAAPTATAQPSSDRQRMIILADMGNEPDEEQQMVHMLVCSNEFDLEGLIAVTGKYLKTNPQPELFHKLIDGYAKVYPNLTLHATGWQTPEYLHRIVAAGQPAYGIADVGEGKSSPGSELIIRAATQNDPRPLYIVVNAGANTLAQALRDYQSTHSAKELAAFISKLRVYENGSQDNAGAWICARYPAIHWIRSNYQTYGYGGPSIDGAADNKGKGNELGPYTWPPFAYSGLGQHQWAIEHLKGHHGPLMALWPIRQFKNGGISFLEGGGTIPWLGLVNKGLYDIEHPHWGGWSGRFSREKTTNYWSKHSDIKIDEEKIAPFAVYKEEPDTWTDAASKTVYTASLYAPVWRWRQAFFNDFVCRADWCVQPFEKANHHPVAALNGDVSNRIIQRNVRAGEKITLDASLSTDPDGDTLLYNWWYYAEAGTYSGTLTPTEPTTPKTWLNIPADAKGTEIHIILEVKDTNPIAALYDYRRLVLHVTK